MERDDIKMLAFGFLVCLSIIGVVLVLCTSAIAIAHTNKYINSINVVHAQINQ